MVEVSLYVEAYVAMRLSFLPELGSKTMQSGIVFQPVLTSDKLLEIARGAFTNSVIPLLDGFDVLQVPGRQHPGSFIVCHHARVGDKFRGQPEQRQRGVLLKQIIARLP
jgi:hypothetical protein